MVEGILQSSGNGAAQYGFSSTGSLVYVSGGVQADQRRLVWVSRNGAEQPYGCLRFQISPNGRKLHPYPT